MSTDSIQFDVLGLNIAQRLTASTNSGNGSTLLVSSARANEGKSFVSTHLAARMTDLLAAPVLLIDANASNPSVHRNFSVGANGGLFDCLRAEQLLADRIHLYGITRLSLMTAKTGDDNSLLFHLGAMQKIMTTLRERFALIIIDGPSLPQVGCLAQQADATVLVIDAERTRRDVIQGAVSNPYINRATIMGVVLNRRPEYVPHWLYRSLL
jgi:Mrp family chromosome partitioning ATPase